MTPRERWNAFWHGRPVDRIPDIEFGYWPETLTRWYEEGLPRRYADRHALELESWFDIDNWERYAPVNVGLLPPFEAKVLEDHGDRRIMIDGEGVISEVFTNGTSSIPHYLEYPIRDRESWKRFRDRLDARTPGRYPDNWAEHVAQLRDRDDVIGVHVGSLFGWVRNWMGFEGVALMVYDDYALLDEIIEHLCALTLTVLDRALGEVQFDYAMFWEDMCFRNGPLISPAHFRDLMVPRYRRITQRLRAAGVDVIMVDCDGRIHELVEHWLSADVNVMFPLEVRAGTDMRYLRDRFGPKLLLCGGVDKTQLAAGHDAIDREVDRVAAMVEEGGYCPHVDHRLPPDVSLVDYAYYLRRKRERLGMV